MKLFMLIAIAVSIVFTSTNSNTVRFMFGDKPVQSSETAELYEALKYSRLVTEDMSHAEMCAVLLDYFPMYLDPITKTLTSSFSVNNVDSSDMDFYSDPIDLTRVAKITISYSWADAFGGVWDDDDDRQEKYYYSHLIHQIGISKTTSSFDTHKYEFKTLTDTNTTLSSSGSNIYTFDVSSLEGNYYIGTLVKTSGGTVSGNGTITGRTNITKIEFEMLN